ncbi:unnamed protein product, partial [Meganyctiphanes norvegica]
MGKYPDLFQHSNYITNSSCRGHVHVVMGNEACDLDSAVCALIYAYHLYSLNQNKKSFSFIPLLNIPQADYALRTEIIFWLRKHDIQEEFLTFRNELDLESQLSNGELEITLVDHNILPANDAALEPAVVQVLDHHKLERQVDSLPNGMSVEMVGSCTTLIAESIKKTNKDIVDPIVASLLHGTILLDTVNLSEQAKRVTPKDIEMVEWLEEYLGNSERESVFKGLTTAKADVSTLTCEQMLRKDLKVASGTQVRVGVASVPMLVKDFLGRSDTNFGNLHEHCELYKYNILVIMGINIVDNNVERDMAIFSEDSSLLNEVSSYLISASDNILKLSSFTCDIKDVKAFSQGNAAASRKVVLPFVKEWLTGQL